MSSHYIIYCDESVGRGEFFSNFYGGLLVSSKNIEGVKARLETAVRSSGLTAEVKWTSTNASIVERYKMFCDAIFEELRGGTIKIRIMFTQNRDVHVQTSDSREVTYNKLYYQFIKHAFGLEHAPFDEHGTIVEVLLDTLPTSHENRRHFKSYLAGLSESPRLRAQRILFSEDRIGEINSRDHILAQAVDVILGAMAFRLNDRHKQIDEENSRRGARTVAKEKLYKHINMRIKELHGYQFNIGVTTACRSGVTDRWHHSYSHWLFVPNRSDRDDSVTKRGQRSKSDKNRTP